MRRREVLRYEGKRRKERRKSVSCLLEHMPGLPFYHPPDFYKVFIEFFHNIVLYLGFFFFWLQGMWALSSPTRDQTRTPYLGKWSHKYWTSREIPHPPPIFLKETFSSVQFSHSVVSKSLRPHGVQHARPLSISKCWSLPRSMSIEPVMPSNHLILCHSLLLLPSILPSIGVFSNESALRIRWPKYWEFQLQHQFFQRTPRTNL